MAANKKLLLDVLERLSLDKDPPDLRGDVSDHLRASLLLVSSHSPESCASAERVAWEEYEDDSTGTPVAVRGVSLPASGMLLRDLVEGLMDLDPAAMAESIPGLEREDYLAGLYAIRCILYCLEWSGDDAAHPAEYDAETRRALIRKSLDQLKSFRETGEP